MDKKEFGEKIIELLRSDGSIIINKKLAWAIGIDAAILYSELISRYVYFDKRGELDKEGYFYNTVEDLRAGTCLERKRQAKAIKRLIKLKLLAVKRGGFRNKRYFKIKCGKVAKKTLKLLLLKDFVVSPKVPHSEEKEPKRALVSPKVPHSVSPKGPHSSNNTNLNNTKKRRGEFFSKIGDKKEEKKKGIPEQLEELKKKGYKI